MQTIKNVLFYSIDCIEWGEHMKSYRQYNKFVMSIWAVLLPTLMLHLNFAFSADSESGYSNTGNDAFDSYANIYKPFLYLNYYSPIAVLPEEEAAAVHFIRAATRYFQYPQRFLHNDLTAAILPFVNIIPSFYLFLNLFTKQVNNTPEMADHTGGHAPPADLGLMRTISANRSFR